MKESKQCFVCGVSAENTDYLFYDIRDIKTPYRVLNYKWCCPKCGDKADSFVDYYGKKSKRDLRRLHSYLMSGVLPKQAYSAMMNGGYY